MAGGVGRPQAQPQPCLISLCWLGWQRHAWSARRGQTVLRYPWRRSRRTVSRSPPDCLASLARQQTDYLAMPVPDCLAAPAITPDFLVSAAGLSCVGRRTVLIVSLDTRKTVLRCPRRTVLRRRRRQGWTAAAVIAHLAGGGSDRRRYVCEMDTAHMEQRLRNTIYLYVGYWYLDIGLDMGLDGPIQFD
jgi:hypothetical protein